MSKLVGRGSENNGKKARADIHPVAFTRGGPNIANLCFWNFGSGEMLKLGRMARHHCPHDKEKRNLKKTNNLKFQNLI